jgi:hypothetical protein
MTSDAELRAFDALGKVPRLSDIVAVTRSLLAPTLEARRAEWRDKERLESLVKEQGLGDEAARTELGDALGVLERGPQNDAERALACALWAHAVAEAPPRGADEEDRVAADLLWLAAHTPFDATGLLDRALGDEAGRLWDALADHVRPGKGPGRRWSEGRAEAIIGCTALATSSSEVAKKQVEKLSVELQDPKLAFVLLAGRGPAGAPSEERIQGEIAPAPRSPWVTAVLGITGILFVMHAARLVARLALAYRRPAEVVLSDSVVRIRSRTEMLGRTLRDRDVLIHKAGLLRATREVRYPRLAFYAGLLALALGSYVGVGSLVDGARTASPSMIVAGLLIVALGIAIDFVLSSLAPGARGRCRILFVPREGPLVCVGGVDVKRADAALARLAHA